MTPPQVHLSTLPNGLRVAVTEMPAARTTRLILGVQVGGRDEPIEQLGLSHFAEHLAFRGNGTHQTESELAQEFALIGAQTNGWTTVDATQYLVAVRPHHLRRALELLKGMVHEPLLNGFEVERRVVLSELRQYAGMEGRLSDAPDDNLRPAWPNDDLCRGATVGTAETVRNLTLEHVRQHFAKYYGARNMVLAVAGPVTHAEVLELLAPFTALTAGDANVRPPPPEPAPGKLHARAASDFSCQLRLLYPLKKCGQEEWSLQMLLNELIGCSPQSRVHRELRSIRGLVYSAWSTLARYSDFAMQIVALEPNPADPVPPFHTVAAMLRALREKGPTREELAAAKERQLLMLAEQFEDPWGMASDAVVDLMAGRPHDLAPQVRAVEAATVDDVAAMARAVLKPGAAHLVYYGAAKHEGALARVFKTL